jgi:hypothetical protein
LKKTAPLIRLYAYGMTVTSDGGRPMLLLKDETGELTLTVPMSPLQAGVTITQSSKTAAPASPHRVTELLLKSMQLQISRCVFKDQEESRQWIELELRNHPFGQTHLRVRAEDGLSLCLHLEVPIYATRAFILAARTYIPEAPAPGREMIVNAKILDRPHPYVM